ncbi:Ras-specific guanine nucleotide-releasing factor RalGPS1 [Anas platyrhynchos]|uniref:Ras-specific guanine nucleotide-releasing factor RalGPS1 n=1 Tax=Anas platyrhynchos TaxID=8839 RepID=R0JVJ4_ANAPL|nr:Ras-specific guanine nucleotide-releasing factor RalGPS1 [Anas platyrhynchos]
MDLMNGQSSSVNIAATASEKSSSSESLSDKGSAELKKSFDAVVFDVLKVTPEEYAIQHLLYKVLCSSWGWLSVIWQVVRCVCEQLDKVMYWT